MPLGPAHRIGRRMRTRRDRRRDLDPHAGLSDFEPSDQTYAPASCFTVAESFCTFAASLELPASESSFDASLLSSSLSPPAA